jgi:hypothetical protein
MRRTGGQKDYECEHGKAKKQLSINAVASQMGAVL